MTADTWFKIRLVLMGLAFLSGLLGPSVTADGFEDTLPLWLIVVICLFVLVPIPFGILLVVGIQAANPLSDKTWNAPSHHANPFRLGNPLLLFHFGAFLVAAGSLGVLLSAAWKGALVAVGGAFGVLAGVSCFLGVKLSMRVCKDKLPKRPESVTSGDEQPAGQPKT